MQLWDVHVLLCLCGASPSVTLHPSDYKCSGKVMKLTLVFEAIKGHCTLASEWWGHIAGWENRLHENHVGYMNASVMHEGKRRWQGWDRPQQEGALVEEETDQGSKSWGQTPCCSLALGVYGNSCKHDISTAASGTAPASNDSPAVQWVVKLWPPELLPSSTNSCHQPGVLSLTLSQGKTRIQEVSSILGQAGFSTILY